MKNNLEHETKLILESTRKQIRDISIGNNDSWFKINRYIYSRLMLDERKLKPKKVDLFDRQRGICWYCNRKIENIKETDLHRIDDKLGYKNTTNVVLVHRSCHQNAQSKKT